ncbi:MAG: HNH endonuclease, partial [Nitrososphaeraceae archaeon]
LTVAVKCAKIDKELVKLLSNKDNANILLNFLLETYFPNTHNNISNNSYLNNIENQIIGDKSQDYCSKILEIQKQLDVNSFQEEVFVRSGIFKRMIPQIYNYSCCISGLRIDAVSNISVIDACHIIPFSEGYNDTINNGIALCPNLHRVFDRGLISIDDNYKVIVSDLFVESEKTNYGIRQFEGSKIILPKDKKHYPSKNSFKFHRDKFGF